ncbi:MAG: pyridoxal phosphate-dependent aminotransferase [Proteobacteria bacterium]|nr:pyridoxal phosphate-dependent aminotransferase [Pseudomonadota bacterium]
MTILASRLSSIKPSPTLQTMAIAQKMKADGKDMIILAAGELDFLTPEWIQQGALQAMEQGLTRYTAVDGLPSLKRAIQDKFNRINKLSYDLDEIMVSSGGKQVLFNAMLCTIENEDEVIIPVPYWVSYGDVVSLFGGKPIYVKTEESNNFKMTASELLKAITNKTKWIILNSPNNPTGAIYTKQELQDIGEVLKEHPNIFILSDDIYEYIVYDQPFVSILEVCPYLKERTLILNGFSKAYAMTGWRLGYGLGPKNLIKAMTMVQSQSTTNANSIAQGAGIIALQGSLSFLTPWTEELIKRRDLCVERISAINGLTCNTPQGAFYIFVNCQGLIGKTTPSAQILKTDQDVCHYLLNYGVAVVPGAAFGLSPYFRISFALSYEDLQKAMDRIEVGISKLQS